MLDNELNCPACGAPTALHDHRCAACQRSLWVRQYEVTRPRPAYWRLVMMEVAFAVGALLLPMALLTYLDLFLQTGNLFTVAAYYLTPVEIPPDQLAHLYEAAPPYLLILSVLPSILTIPIPLCILTRRMVGLIIAMGLDALRIIVSIAHAVTLLTLRFGHLPPDSPWVALAQNQFVGYVRTGYGAGVVILTVISALLLITLVSLQDHFVVESLRILLTVDRDVRGNYLNLWLRGRDYAKRKIWAKAALHLRQALLMQQTPDAYLLLTVAYLRLSQDQEAERALNAAEAHGCDPARVAALRRELASYRTRQAKEDAP